MKQSEFNDKVQQKLDDKKVKQYVDDLYKYGEIVLNDFPTPFVFS